MGPFGPALGCYGSFGLVGCRCAHPEVHVGSLGAFGRAQGVVGAHSGASWVHSSTRPWGHDHPRQWRSLGSFCPRSLVRWVRSGSLGSFGRATDGFGCIPARLGCRRVIRVRWVISCPPCRRRVHRGSFGAVVWFIRVRWLYSGVLLGLSGSFVFVGFIRSRPGGLWVQSGTHSGRRVYSGSLGPLMLALGVIGLVWFRWVY